MISPYRSCYVDEVSVDLGNIKGIDGVLLEMKNRSQSGNKTLPKSWFRASCKRNECSQTDALYLVKKLGWIEGDSFPYGTIIEEMEFRSYDGWRMAGRTVVKGATSYARYGPIDIDANVAVFERIQTKDIIQSADDIFKKIYKKIKEVKGCVGGQGRELVIYMGRTEVHSTYNAYGQTPIDFEKGTIFGEKYIAVDLMTHLNVTVLNK